MDIIWDRYLNIVIGGRDYRDHIWERYMHTVRCGRDCCDILWDGYLHRVRGGRDYSDILWDGYVHSQRWYVLQGHPLGRVITESEVVGTTATSSGKDIYIE